MSHQGKEYYECSTAKQKSRELVLNFLLANHQSSTMNFFGLPSTNWTFENMLINAYSKIHIVGAEHTPSYFRRASYLLPGREKENAKHQILINRPRLEMVYTEKATLFLCELSRLLKEAAYLSNSTETLKNCFRWTAVWLDICGTVESVKKYTACLANGLSRKVKQVPVALTFATSRENPLCFKEIESKEVFEKRLIFISRCFENVPGWKIKGDMEAYKYPCATGSTKNMGLSLMILERT